MQRTECGFTDNGAFAMSAFVFATAAFRQQRRFRKGDIFRNRELCDALYHDRVRFLPVLAQICGCER